MDVATTADRRSGYICVRDVRKVYDSGRAPIEALSGTSFEAQQGEFVAILGPSGCGKSTLLMMCAGLETVTSGTIEHRRRADDRSAHRASA